MIDSNDQPVEQMIKFTTEVAKRVNSFNHRHQEILNCLASRSEIPHFESKKSYPIRSMMKNT